MDAGGTVLAKGRVAEGVEGLARMHELVATYAEEPSEVVVGIEIDRGLLVGSLVAAGYAVHAINPLSVDRYRDRHRVSGAKSDPGDARVLADLVRTDQHLHRQVAGDSELAEATKVLARAHQSLIWSRQRHLNQLRSALREFYPAALQAFGTDLASGDALGVLAQAPTPAEGRSLSAAKIATALKRAGRRRRVAERAKEIRSALRSFQLQAPEVLSLAYGEVVRSDVAIVAEMTSQIDALARELEDRFEEHPDAEILRSLPGLGLVLGARVLAEFGDDPTRYADPKARKNYAGTSPITKASGRSKVALARFARNRRLADALQMWAFCSLSTSAGARRYYDAHRAKGHAHRRALRSLANRWVGILHGCLEHRVGYSEDVAWPTVEQAAASQLPPVGCLALAVRDAGGRVSELDLREPADFGARRDAKPLRDRVCDVVADPLLTEEGGREADTGRLVVRCRGCRGDGWSRKDTRRSDADRYPCTLHG